MAQDKTLEEDVFTGRFDWDLWRRVLAFATPYKKQLAILCAMALLVAVLDTGFPILTGKLIDSLTAHIDHGADAHFGYYLAINIAMVVVFVVAIFTFIIAAGRISNGVSHDIRKRSFEKLQELPFSFYDRKAVGWLMARLTSDCGRISGTLAWALLDVCWGASVLVLIAVAMFWSNWRVAMVVVLIMLPLGLVCRHFQIKLLLLSRALRKANSQTTAAYNEGIVGVRTTKSMVREERNLDEFTHLTDTMYGLARSTGMYEAVFLPLVLAVCSMGIGLALWRGGVQVIWGGMSVGDLVKFLQFAAFIQHPAWELANAITRIQGAQASIERVQSLLDADLEIVDSPEVIAALATNHRPSGIAADGHPDRIETIEFRDVTFAYKQGQVVLRNFNLTVNAGETIALVGPTGGGKTTIVGLACRFYQPTQGQVLINGLDYRQRSLKWLQSNLGMVLQQPHLFSGTIRENIRYGRLDATDSEIEHAATMTNADEFITTFEKGYDTQVGEGGNQLSTGQKQLIALARAIIADPQIFVMDEATSSVDTHTDRCIQQAVERVLEGRISFVIAHRLSTIRSADRILVIDAGQIIEQGNHRDLLARRGRYYELYTNQFTHEREEQMLHEEPAVVS